VSKPPPSSISDWIDLLLAWLKWPAAALSLSLLPGAATAMFGLLARIAAQPRPMLMFLIGFVAYMVLWWQVFCRSRFSLVLSLEHELTHAQFALLTFHRVTNMRVTAFRGGRMQFVGRGNWIIMVAPYFFPTVSLAMIAVLFLLPSSVLPLGDALVGASFAYHLTSTLRETRSGQTDIQQAGRLFCFLFLPAANVLSAGVILAFSHDGVQGLSAFLTDVVRSSGWLATWWGG
jgi:hypothetical protein